MRICFIGDIHGKVSSPLDRLTDYNEDLFAQMRWLIDFMNDKDIKYAVHLGDLFDKPEMPDWWKNRFIETWKSYKGQLYSIIGMAHDLFYNREESYEKTGLYNLELSGILKVLREPITLEHQIQLLPLSMKIDNAKEDLKTIQSKFDMSVEHHIMLAHQFYKWSLDESAGFIESDFAHLSTYRLHLILGHDHRQHDTELAYSTYIDRPGSFMRTELSEDTINIKPRVLLFDTDSAYRDYITVKCRDINEIYNIAEYRHRKASTKTFKQIRNSIQEIANYLHKDESIISCSQALKELDCPIEEYNYLKSVHQICNQQF